MFSHEICRISKDQLPGMGSPMFLVPSALNSGLFQILTIKQQKRRLILTVFQAVRVSLSFSVLANNYFQVPSKFGLIVLSVKCCVVCPAVISYPFKEYK